MLHMGFLPCFFLVQHPPLTLVLLFLSPPQLAISFCCSLSCFLVLFIKVLNLRTRSSLIASNQATIDNIPFYEHPYLNSMFWPKETSFFSLWNLIQQRWKTEKKLIFLDSIILLSRNVNPSRHAPYRHSTCFSESLVLNGTSWISADAASKPAIQTYRSSLCFAVCFFSSGSPRSHATGGTTVRGRTFAWHSPGNLDSEEEISLLVHLTCIKWLWTYWALHI